MIDELLGPGAPVIAREPVRDELELERETFGELAHAWTAPRTWVTSEVVTSSIMNTHVRDNLLALDAQSRRFTVTDIQNTTTEQSLYDGSAHGAATGWQVAAGVMGTDKRLELRLAGDFLYNRADGDTLTLRVYVGNVLLASHPGLVDAGLTSATREGWEALVVVTNLGSASSQLARLEARARAELYSIGTTLGTTNTASSWYLDVTAQWSVASANNSWRIREAIYHLR